MSESFDSGGRPFDDGALVGSSSVLESLHFSEATLLVNEAPLLRRQGRWQKKRPQAPPGDNEGCDQNDCDALRVLTVVFSHQSFDRIGRVSRMNFIGTNRVDQGE